MVDQVPAMTAEDAELRADLLGQLGSLATDPERAARFANGLILDGTAQRLGILSGLKHFMKVPEAEAKRMVRARMADLIQRLVSATGSVTRDNLIGGGFTPAEIDEHFTDAKRIARVTGMVT